MNVKLAVLGVDGHRNKAGKTFHAEGVALTEGRVPVWLEAYSERDHDFAHLIGHATLSVHDGVLWADCGLLDWRLPGSLLAILYPQPVGDIIEVAGDAVKKILVKGVNIGCDAPLDERIPSLSAQGVKARVRG